jgi:hypothetical protein
MHVQILGGSLHRADLRTRMPFRYGIATMTAVPLVFLRLDVAVEGRRVAGIASDCLPPKWFTKVPETPLEAEVDEMLRVIRHALGAAVGSGGASAFAVWRELYDEQMAWARAEQIPALLANFGTSLVERALLEAVARAHGRSFAALLRANRLGIALGDAHPELRGLAPAEFLPATPLPRVIARHTVGLADPLTDADIPAAERLDDGLPQSLAACIRAYGLRHFKVKVNGDLARDLDRLRRIAEVLATHAPADCAFTLDGNEQFKSVEQFREFWETITPAAGLREFFGRLLFVEQPLHRDAALRPEAGRALRAWPGRPPLIIDESDGALEDLPAALDLGYAGTSHKNCKGVFKGIAHACLLAHRRRAAPAQRLVLSGEDLCNLGPVALLQDLAVMAALGIQSVERNGHHYHAGLSQFPAAVQQQVLGAHPDLYHASPAGWPTLRIVGGAVELESVNRAPFGVGFELALDALARVE